MPDDPADLRGPLLEWLIVQMGEKDRLIGTLEAQLQAVQEIVTQFEAFCAHDPGGFILRLMKIRPEYLRYLRVPDPDHVDETDAPVTRH